MTVIKFQELIMPRLFRLKNILFLLGCFFLLANNGFAQDEYYDDDMEIDTTINEDGVTEQGVVLSRDTIRYTKIHSTLQFDSSAIQLRKYNESELEGFRNDSDFQYGREVKRIPDNLLQQLLQWIYETILRPVFSNTSSVMWKYILIGICGVIVLYAILRLIKADWVNIFSGKSKKSGVGFTELEENIHELDFDKLISEAIANENYTRAVRLFYLKSLKKLSDKDLINWQFNKTNHDYMYELAKQPFVSDFERLTYLFEYVCYGDFHLNEPDFREVEKSFRSFEQKIG